MPIVVLGASYKTAPLDFREKLALPSQSLTSALRLLASDYAQEGVILTTCHRTELYALVSESQEMALPYFWIQARGIPQEELGSALYHLREEDAIRHLFRIAAGLESAILGESEVLGQVRKAMEEALAAGACGPVLSRLFNGAVAAGKRARTDSGISREPVSLATTAVLLAEQTLRTLQGRKVLVVGVGEMGAKALNYLHAKGSEVTVINRNPQRARARAEFAPASVFGFEALEGILPEVDLVISSTAAPHPVISAQAVERAMALRQGRPLLFVDLALPRDVDPLVRSIPGIRLFDIDELSRVVESNRQRRQKEVPEVEAILHQEVESFMDWYRSRQAVPTIVRLRSRAQTIQKKELDRALRRLGSVSPRERQVIEQLANSIINQLLHYPTVRLKEESSKGNGVMYAEALHTLFGLDKPGDKDE